MSENLNQSEVLSNQASLPSNNSPYEDTSIPYIPLQQRALSPQKSLQPGVSNEEQNRSRLVFPQSKDGTGGAGALVAGVLGALVGWVLGQFLGGNLALWVIGGIFCGFLATTFSDRDWLNVVSRIFERL